MGHLGQILFALHVKCTPAHLILQADIHHPKHIFYLGQPDFTICDCTAIDSKWTNSEGAV